jgi:hypothetical protein
MAFIVRMVFGSHLYGTSTPESDTDYKGVYFPTVADVLLQRVKKSRNFDMRSGNAGKNTSADVDEEIYSLLYFVALACQGQMVALDMLHAPKTALTHSSELWADLSGMRAKFYTRSLKSLVGYAMKQAAKYGVKGSRLAAVQHVVGVMRRYPAHTRIRDIWDALPDGEYIRRCPHTDDRPDRFYEVCGKQLLDASAVGHYLPMLEAFIDEYGKRALAAKLNVGVDWKAISHAFRAAYQVRAILADGGFEYPLREAPFLVQVKRGEIPYKDAAATLDDLMDECRRLSAASTLPESVDRKFWDEWLIERLSAHLGVGHG